MRTGIEARRSAGERLLATFAVLPLAAGAIYLVVPGHPWLPLHGPPIGLAGAALLTVLIAALWWYRDIRVPWRTVRLPVTLLALAIVGKMLLSVFVPHAGWIARYYNNEKFAGPYEPSTDFPRLGATRIDRVIDFENATLPAYFLNHLRLEQPSGRSQLVVEQPLSIAWTGYVTADAPTSLPITLEARGSAWLVVDSVEQARVTASRDPAVTRATIDFVPGVHRIDVAYVKPANAIGLIRVTGIDGVAADEVSAVRLGTASLWLVLAWLFHAIAGFGTTMNTVTLARTRARRAVSENTAAAEDQSRENRHERWLAAAAVAVFAVQGLVAGVPHVGRVWDLTTGDDWFGFEARARDVLVNGPLMTLGAPIGEGQPFFFYPLYSYFAAAVHWLVGEDGSGIVFAQFLVLAVTTIVVFRLARDLFGERIAVGATALLVLIEQLAFTRYYTVTMLADNLYVLPVALAVLWLTRVATSDRLAPIVWSGIWVGIAALTKPGMLAFFAASIPFVIYVRPVFSRAALYVAVTLAVIGLATLRNVVVSGQPVLITQGQGPTFIYYSLAPDLVAKGGYTAAPPIGLADNLSRVVRIAAEHPVDYLRWNARKVVFSLGFVHLQSGYRPHPELLVTTFGWLAALAFVPAARARQTWPAHLFAISHLATMALTLPWVYGYRLILPTFVIIPVFAAAAADAVWARFSMRVTTPSAVR